jgi:carboxypeptidase PM20D1
VLLLLLFVAFAVLATWRTIRAGRSASLVPVAVAPLQFDLQGAAAHLGEAIRIPTIGSHEDPEAAAAELASFRDWLTDAYPAFHEQATREVIAGGTLLYEWPGRDASLAPMVLMAHQDVVPAEAEDRWSFPPFSGDLIDGAVAGRGALDNKGSLVAMLEAAEALAAAGERPARTVIFVFGHDEETRGEGAAAAAQVLAARGVQAEFVLDEGSFVIADHPVTGDAAALIGITEKGYATVRVTARAEGGHASAPPRETAVGVLAQALETLLENPFPRRYEGATRAMLEALAPQASRTARIAIANPWLLRGLLVRQLGATPQGAAMLQTTIAPTMLSGSSRENVLATEASATLNLRIAPGDTVDAALRHLRESLEGRPVTVELVGEGRDPAPVSSTDSEGYALIAGLAHSLFGATVAPAPVIAATDSRSMTAVSPHIYRFQPVRLALADTAMIHGIDERLPLEALEKMIRFYGALFGAAGAGATAASASTSPATIR